MTEVRKDGRALKHEERSLQPPGGLSWQKAAAGLEVWEQLTRTLPFAGLEPWLTREVLVGSGQGRKGLSSPSR